ncbi:GTP-binding protein 8-like [Ostrea edulis]|uniref:GTP-binding protein 8-like n=1 Tax=Ostrea edulis TaxID=37623 RepID=UPI0024AEBF79|nr:GTP-binding protein 8-like [Ostrea edulis]XP_056013286.1 GTP-binding protein 8-like [Ostrea edulis]XP_056013287.1 GTP-binding protein 8-like [Ostrea edulis]
MSLITTSLSSAAKVQGRFVYRNVVIHRSRKCPLGESRAYSWRINPIEDLQDLVTVPLLQEKDCIFNPSVNEIEKGHELFIQKPGHKIKKVKSVVNLEKLPVQNIPEVSFVGQSNVGKTSLISALFGNAVDSHLIKIGKTPGLTKTLQFFNVGKQLSLVDMPGYGKNIPSYYMESMHTYLQTRRVLCRSFLLVDSEAGLTDLDKEGLRMMEDLAKPYAIVLTKIDKPRQSVLVKNLMEVLDHAEKKTHICFPQPFLTCAPSLAGIKYLQTFIAHVTGNLQLHSHEREEKQTTVKHSYSEPQGPTKNSSL